MNKVFLGKSDLEVSELGFGCMSLGLDHKHNAQLLHYAVEHGINYFDTADLYDQGENEITVGKAFKGMRDQVILATKVGNVWKEDGSSWDWNPSKAYIKEAVFESLKRLQTDYIDLYQLHGGTIDDPIEETIQAFEELKAEGWIRFYGISSIRPNVIRDYIDKSNIVSNMMQYSLLDRRPEEEMLSLLEKNGVSVVVRGAVAKGLLINKEATDYLEYTKEEISNLQQELRLLRDESQQTGQLALRYVLAHPAVATVALGASKLEQLKDNLKLVSVAPLTEEELSTLTELTKPVTYVNHR